MNVHKRCQKNVANNCGINPNQIALLLEELRISDNNNVPVKPKAVRFIILLIYFSFDLINYSNY